MTTIIKSKKSKEKVIVLNSIKDLKLKQDLTISQLTKNLFNNAGGDTEKPNENNCVQPSQEPNIHKTSSKM